MTKARGRPVVGTDWRTVAMLVCLSGCAARDIGLQGSPGPSETPPRLDWSDLGYTLSRITVGGKVSFEELAECRPVLDRLLARVAAVGPTTTPNQLSGRDAQLAYYINCANAATLRSIDQRKTDGPLPLAAPLDRRYRFRIDGGWLTPADLRATALSLAGNDWRVLLVLYDGRRDGPPLYPRVLLADVLDAQLNEAARTALLDPRIVRIDHGLQKRLLLWRPLFNRREELAAKYDRRLGTRGATILNVLLEWADSDRRALLNASVGYEVAALPADPTLEVSEPVEEDSSGPFAGFKLILQKPPG